MLSKTDKVLITGVTSGLGEALFLKLKGLGFQVLGIGRRKGNYGENYISVDLSKHNAWKKIMTIIKQDSFNPDIVVFNAAISQNDLDNSINTSKTREMFDINFFSVIEGVRELLDYVKPKTQFIVISSSSAFKGSNSEGIGYPSSKAAISIAFESLYLKYQNKFQFKTIYFGPISTGMNPYKTNKTATISRDRAVNKIITALNSKNILFYYPPSLFTILKIIKMLPPRTYFTLLNLFVKLRRKFD